MRNAIPDHMLRVRKVEPSDKPLLDAAAMADPYHAAAGLTGDHWAGHDSICYEDESGPVVALKTTNVVRVDIQFLTQDKLRNANALVAGFYQYIGVLRNRKVNEVVFSTQSPEVAHFMQKRFHFRSIGGSTYSLWIGD
jgi:hypothetical protein